MGASVAESELVTLPPGFAPAAAIGRLQLSEEVAAHLREAIMSGELRPGEFVRLDTVAQRLGTSVTPVREALLLLRGEDMVRLLPRRGFVVSPLTRVDVEDLFDVQARLAGELVARAVARVTDDELTDITAVNDQLIAALTAESADRIEALEYQFHRALNMAAHSRKLAYILRSASQYLPRHFYSGNERWRSAVRRDHDRILAAMKDRDAHEARAAIEAHVLDGKERLLRHLDDSGFWDSANE